MLSFSLVSGMYAVFHDLFLLWFHCYGTFCDCGSSRISSIQFFDNNTTCNL